MGQLAEMPFLDRRTLAVVTDRSEAGVYAAVRQLEDAGLIGSVPHATSVLSRVERYYLTVDGVCALAETEGIDVAEALRRHPVSAQWQRLMLGRLDLVGIVYRIVAAIADIEHPVGLIWYRAAPLDAGITLAGSRVIGIVRQGPMSDRTSFGKRMARLRDAPRPSGLLVVSHDEIQLRHTRRTLVALRLPTFLALERDVGQGNGATWGMPGSDVQLDVASILRKVSINGSLPVEPQPAKASIPTPLAVDEPLERIADWLLPSVLRPTKKRVLDAVADWPGITHGNLARLIGLQPSRLSHVTGPLTAAQLLTVISIGGRRLALGDRALSLLARRDRSAIGIARQRWSVSPINSALPSTWRNISGRRVRQLLRHIEHTDAVHGYLASTAERARADGWEIVQFDPPHRASRYFRQNGKVHSVHPDAFGMMRRGRETKSFFLEWERRAVRPSTMRQRLAPYLRYYSTTRPRDDHGTTPEVIIVLRDEVSAANFRRVAEQEMVEARVLFPLRLSRGIAHWRS